MDTSTIDVRDLPGTEVHTVVAGQGYFPVIAGLGGPRLAVALRGGAGHLGLGGRLDVVRCDDGGRTWSAPVTAADSERDGRNPAFGVAADGALVLAYHWRGNYDAQGVWKGDADPGPTDTRVTRSRDGGRTWSEDRLLEGTALNGASPFGKIRRDGDGTLLMPMYGGPGEVLAPAGTPATPPANAPTYLLRSSDGGQSWGRPILVAVGLNEADLLILAADDWLFAARSEQGARPSPAAPATAAAPGGSWRR